MKRAFRIGGRGHVERDVDEELAFHIQTRIDRLVAAGMPPDDARREALRQFGAVDPVRDYCVTIDHERERAMERVNLFEEFLHDIGYAIRSLRHNFAFTTTVIATLALGIGANTGIFTMVNAVLLRPLPVPNATSLVAVGNPTRVTSMSFGSARGDYYSYPLYKDLRDDPTTKQLVSGIMATGRADRLSVKTATGAQSIRARYVSGNYFDVLGVRAAKGRVFGASEDAAVGSSPVVVISEKYRATNYGERVPVGEQLTVNGVSMTIVGVTSADFTGEIVGQYPDMWVPITMQPILRPHDDFLESRGANWLIFVGVLKNGITIERAKKDFGVLVNRILKEKSAVTGPPEDVPVSSAARGLSRIRETYKTPLLTLLVGVGLLMLIVCANVANLMLARSVARAREISVRVALGASRPRLLRQLMTESGVLALLGAGAGLFVSLWASKGLLLLVADGGSMIPIDVRPDWMVLGFTLGVAVIAVGLFGLAPAVRATRVDVATTMRATSRSVGSLGGRGHRLPMGKVLITAQVALSFLLLTGAGLLVRSLQTLNTRDAGLDRDKLLMVAVDIVGRGLDSAGRPTYIEQLHDRVTSVPGVTGVSYSENGIFGGTESMTTFTIEGFVARTQDDSVVAYDQVGPGYFSAIGATLLDGREINERDTRQSPVVAVVNQSFVKKYFPNGALGKRIRIDSLQPAEIVGVVRDVNAMNLRVDPVPRAYFSYDQHPYGEAGSLTLAVHSNDPGATAIAVRKSVSAMDPSLTISTDPLSSLMRTSIREERLMARLTSGFGILALLLAAIGLYGVMTYAITRRTGEIGLRVALGARRGNIVSMVLGDALRLVAAGLVIGIPLAIAASRLLRGQLYGVGPSDPVATMAALFTLAFSAVVAAALPAWRAARVAPLVALRQE